MAEYPQEHWHLDKRVPIALIFTLVIQLFAFGWFMNGLASDNEVNRRDIDRQEVRILNLETSSNAQAIQLGRMEEVLFGVDRNIQKLLENQENNQKNRNAP